eukprot:scaffold2310_cov164-Amphora_coffeaeformis.AAC.8
MPNQAGTSWSSRSIHANGHGMVRTITHYKMFCSNVFMGNGSLTSRKRQQMLRETFCASLFGLTPRTIGVHCPRRVLNKMNT